MAKIYPQITEISVNEKNQVLFNGKTLADMNIFLINDDLLKYYSLEEIVLYFKNCTETIFEIIFEISKIESDLGEILTKSLNIYHSGKSDYSEVIAVEEEIIEENLFYLNNFLEEAEEKSLNIKKDIMELLRKNYNQVFFHFRQLGDGDYYNFLNRGDIDLTF